MSLLAIDIGSSQCKAVVFTAAGAVIARSVHAYAADFPQPGFAEMDPAKFWTRGVSERRAKRRAISEKMPCRHSASVRTAKHLCR